MRDPVNVVMVHALDVMLDTNPDAVLFENGKDLLERKKWRGLLLTLVAMMLQRG